MTCGHGKMHGLVYLALVSALGTAQAVAQPPLPRFAPRPVAPQAARFRATGQVVPARPDGMIHLEAEEFRVLRGPWQAKSYGENFYVSTFAVTFLSRKAFLAAPPQAQDAVAEIRFQVPRTGNYLVLARYESAYRYHTQFRVVVEQQGKVKLSRIYGSRDNVRIWPFGRRLQKDLTWPWGANEQIVWEGHDVRVPLEAGTATLRLEAVAQPNPATWRHVDCLLLTTDEEEVQRQLRHARYLPLDGLLTQAGDVWAQVENHSRGTLQVTLPNCIAHSPYYVHLRTWKPRRVVLKPGEKSPWVEIGSLLDGLNESVWIPRFASQNGPLNYTLRLAVKQADGKQRYVFSHRGEEEQLGLYVSGAMRYHPLVMLRTEALPELLDYLDYRAREMQLPPGRLQLFPLYAHRSFAPIQGNPAYNRLVRQWWELFPLWLPGTDRPGTPQQPRGYIDVRHIPTEQLEAYCRNLQQQGVARLIRVVSLGDEIGLAVPREGQDEPFRKFLQQLGLKPQQVVPGAKSWQQVKFTPPPDPDQEPRRYYYARRYAHHYGIQAIKVRTDILRRYLPAAGIGANYSPHQDVPYLGRVHKWIHVFRRQGMTLPWSEDYCWQVPIVSPQLNSLGLDMFRAALRGTRQRDIKYYVLAHHPGNHPLAWRRLFYAALGHGMTIANVYELQPLPVGYTENYCNLPETYFQVLRAARELTRFEDIVVAGRVPQGNVGLWFSEVADIWHDDRPPLAAEKRTLYVALRQLQLPLEVVTEEEAVAGKLAPYRVLYVTSRHISRRGAEALLDWVEKGGRLFLYPAAGSRDEFNQPLPLLYQPLGIKPPELEVEPQVRIDFVKQDLAFAPAVGRVFPAEKGKEAFAVYGAKAPLGSPPQGEVLQRFQDKQAALCRVSLGRGEIYYCGYLPALAAVRPSARQVPPTRGGELDGPSHSTPTRWQPEALAVLKLPAAELKLPVEATPRQVETCLIDSPHGTVLVLVAWDCWPRHARVVLRRPVPLGRIETASGTPVRVTHHPDGTLELLLRVDYADAVIFRPE